MHRSARAVGDHQRLGIQVGVLAQDRQVIGQGSHRRDIAPLAGLGGLAELAGHVGPIMGLGLAHARKDLDPPTPAGRPRELRNSGCGVSAPPSKQLGIDLGMLTMPDHDRRPSPYRVSSVSVATSCTDSPHW